MWNLNIDIVILYFYEFLWRVMIENKYMLIINKYLVYIIYYYYIIYLMVIY